VSRYEHGDEYRWSLKNRGPTTIAVIEPPAGEAKDKPKPRRTVPFGFARALPPAEPREPQLWEGDDS
jgi:hypothetical protein